MSNEAQTVTRVWTILNILKWTTGYLKQRGIENARPDAEVLLAHTLNYERIDLYLYHDQPLHANELNRFKTLIQRRARHEPVAYITGVKEFWSLEFKVTPDVLIPRPETEVLVASALRLCDDSRTFRVLEMGTGSGIISVSLAHERPQWHFWATDISRQAIAIARFNASKYLPKKRISFSVGSWFDAIDGGSAGFDLIVSNPPYITRDELARLDPNIRRYEPVSALDGGLDGLAGIAHIIHNAPLYLKQGGWLLIEIGYDQGDAAKTLGQKCGEYEEIEIEKDMSGHDRLICLHKMEINDMG